MVFVTSLYIFIDASNLWQAQKAKGRFFDYQKLIEHLRNRFRAATVKVFYYTAYPADGTRTYSLEGKHKFFTFLKKGLGFEVRKKPLKRISVIQGDTALIQEKGNMDVEMTIDAMHYVSNYTTAIFFSGDSDFLALVSYLRRVGKKVYIFSSKNNISSELRTGSNGYFDVLNLGDGIWGRSLEHRSRR